MRAFASVGALMTALARFFLMLPVVGLVACSGSGSGGASGSSSGAAMPVAGGAGPAAQPFRMKTGDDGDDDLGRMQDKFGSRSPFMTDSKGKPMGEYRAAGEFDRANTQFDRGYAGKEYKAGEFKKKSFWGHRDYAKAVYGGDTNANGLRKGSRFQDAAAGENVKVARDGSRTYDTGAYATGAARETGKRRLDKVADAETTDRTNIFTDPEIIPWQQQHGVTIDETRSKMGRR